MADRCPDCTELTLCAQHAAEAPMFEPPQFDPLAEARRLLAEDAEARAQACRAEIDAVLDRYGMRLEISTPQVAIVPAQ